MHPQFGKFFLVSGGNEIGVLSVKDVTDEIRMEAPGLKKTWLYRID